MYTLDTNILIYFATGEKSVGDFLLSHLENDDTFFLPSIVVVEFFSFAALKKHDRDFFSSLLPQLSLVPLDLPLALQAAALRRIHRKTLADCVVAATAVQTESTLITRNVRDYRHIKGLALQAL